MAEGYGVGDLLHLEVAAGRAFRRPAHGFFAEASDGRALATSGHASM